MKYFLVFSLFLTDLSACHECYKELKEKREEIQRILSEDDPCKNQKQKHFQAGMFYGYQQAMILIRQNHQDCYFAVDDLD